jgi:hypothetical protein
VGCLLFQGWSLHVLLRFYFLFYNKGLIIFGIRLFHVCGEVCNWDWYFLPTIVLLGMHEAAAIGSTPLCYQDLGDCWVSCVLEPFASQVQGGSDFRSIWLVERTVFIVAVQLKF